MSPRLDRRLSFRRGGLSVRRPGHTELCGGHRDRGGTDEMAAAAVDVFGLRIGDHRPVSFGWQLMVVQRTTRGHVLLSRGGAAAAVISGTRVVRSGGEEDGKVTCPVPRR